MNKQKKSFAIEIFIVIGLITIVSLIVFRRYIFEGYCFLSDDSLTDILRANLPTYYYLFDNISDGFSLWSWKMGIGTSTFSHADVYFDPFTYVTFLRGREFIPQMLVWIMVVKIVAEGAAFYIYISYFNVNRFAKIIAACTYAFSGYSLIMGSNFALGTVLVYLPFVFLGVEKLLFENKRLVLIVSLFLTCICSYYFFYNVGIIAAIYLLFRINKDDRKKVIVKLIDLAVIGIAVIGLSFFSLYPQIELAMNSPRVSGEADVQTGLFLFLPKLRSLITALVRNTNLDVFGNSLDKPFYGLTYNSKNYFECSTYSSFLIYPLLLSLYKNEKKYRKSIVAGASICFLAILFPVVSFVFNAFSTINYRWMFVFSLINSVVIAFAINSIISLRKISITDYLYGVVASLASLFIADCILATTEDCFELAMGNLFHTSLFWYVYLVIIYIAVGLVIGYYNHSKSVVWAKNVMAIILLGLVIIDISVNYYSWYGSNNNICEYGEVDGLNYLDESAEIISEIRTDDSGFYRINKNFDSVVDDLGIPSDNDAMVQNYYGLKNYNSLNNANYIKFLTTSGVYVACEPNIEYFISVGMEPQDVVGSSLNYCNGVYDKYFLMSYLGVKYYLANSAIEVPSGFELMRETEDIKVYKNNNYYPLAFVNENMMSLKQFETLTDEEKELALVEYTIVDDNTITKKEIVDDEKYISILAEEKRNRIEMIDFSEDSVRFNIDVKESGIMSLSMPFDKGWHIYVDGKEIDTMPVNISLLGARIDEGNHEVELRYVSDSFERGIFISIGFLLITGIAMLLIKVKTNEKVD